MSITLILGSADSLDDDVASALRLIGDRPYRVVACNQSVFAWAGRLDHFATMHPEEMAPWLARRDELGYPGGYETWTRVYPYGLKERERLCDHVIGGFAHGSSGKLALEVAVQTGGTRNMLCGIPMDGRPHFNGGEWAAHKKYREGWIEDARRLSLTTRSWSGWTRELLGAPDESWLPGWAGKP